MAPQTRSTPARPRFAGHLNNLAAGRAPHDGVVNEQDGFILKLQRHGVQLLSHRLFPLTLPRHDESAPDVAVFHEPFAELDA